MNLGSCCVLLAALTSTATLAAAVPPPAQPTSPSTVCRKLPPGKRVVRLTLKPETTVDDLIVWISSITCKQFIVPGGIGSGKTVTITSPELITPEEAYGLFLAALDSVGLTVYATGPFLRVIETAKAKTSPIPFVVPRRAPSL